MTSFISLKHIATLGTNALSIVVTQYQLAHNPISIYPLHGNGTIFTPKITYVYWHRLISNQFEKKQNTARLREGNIGLRKCELECTIILKSGKSHGGQPLDIFTIAYSLIHFGFCLLNCSYYSVSLTTHQTA